MTFLHREGTVFQKTSIMKKSIKYKKFISFCFSDCNGQPLPQYHHHPQKINYQNLAVAETIHNSHHYNSSNTSSVGEFIHNNNNDDDSKSRRLKRIGNTHKLII